MLRRIFCLICLLISNHLYASAGDSISVFFWEKVKPVFSIQVDDALRATLQNNLQEKGKEVLALYMVTNGKRASIPVAGKYKLSKNNYLSFILNYPLGYNTDFEAVYTLNGKLIDIKRFTTPKHPLSDKRAEVVTAYPMADTIPYNTLFFHVRFSHPMKEDILAYKHISIYDDQGIERENAWRQKSFWLDDGKLLVLMIHPGRVKNGIHYESPLFDSGKRYTLKVHTTITDINNNPIAKEYTQSFYVKGEDRVTPKVELSDRRVLTHGARGIMYLNFSEGMDHASVMEGVALYNAKGRQLKIALERVTESRYMFYPMHTWERGAYKLVLKSAVYDYAANRINRLFEVTDAKEMEKDEQDTVFDLKVR